jgi:uncharacterized protein (DUF2141 family)
MFRRIAFLAATVALGLPSLASAADLAIEIDNIRAQQGPVKVAVMASAAAWNGQGMPAAVTGGVPDGDGTLSLKVAGLAPGRYAVRVMHDENGNGQLDRNFVGMPTEGYGFSNNPRAMRAATFEEAGFDVGDDGASVRIVLR